MKNPSAIVYCLCFMLSAVCVNAQTSAKTLPIPLNEPNYNKPKLFQNLPDTIALNVAVLNNLFSSEKDQSVSMSMGSKSSDQFEGSILSKATNADGTTNSVVFRASNFNGACFTITKVINTDKTERYVGRIVNFQYGDLYELQLLNGNYQLIKRNFYELVNE